MARMTHGLSGIRSGSAPAGQRPSLDLPLSGQCRLAERDETQHELWQSSPPWTVRQVDRMADMAIDQQTAPAARARALLRRAVTAVLATRLQPREAAESDPMAGWPYASLVLTAAAMDGSPLLLLSELAQHTIDARADSRVALAVTEMSMTGPADGVDPLTLPRATLLGRLQPDPLAADRFLARHPQSRDYAGFGDFAFWRLEVERVHLVAGFGRIAWAQGRDYPLDMPVGTLAAAEAGIVGHMNADHADAIDLYATRLCGRAPGAWRMIACDPEGIDMLSGAGDRARLDFDAPVADAAGARTALVALVRRAREGAGAA